jgi:5-methylthioadenosine/S-adenosylhomocysteine deaminase
MLCTPSDVNIKARWIAPMSGSEELLENHTLVIGDGRILDVLPHSAAAERFAPRIELERPAHLVMPGLVNARTRLAPPAGLASMEGFWADGALLGIANMVRTGTTSFCDVGLFPQEAAAVAIAQGLRAVIGLPVSASPSAWAQSPGEYLTRALGLRDEYRDHPSISTRFALLGAAHLDDESLGRLATLAAELDAGLLVSLHESRHDSETSLRLRRKRPLQRFQDLGLLGPASTVAHAADVDDADLELLLRSGSAVTLSLASDLMRGRGTAAIDALGTAPLRIGLGSDAEHCGPGQDLWSEIRLLALHSPGTSPAGVLGAATRGGAAALGLEAETGTLERGKWADVCCLDLSGPAMQPMLDPLRQLAFAGARDLVSDVWVGGRQLLAEGNLTRLDWPELAARLSSRQTRSAILERA